MYYVHDNVQQHNKKIKCPYRNYRMNLLVEGTDLRHRVTVFTPVGFCKSKQFFSMSQQLSGVSRVSFFKTKLTQKNQTLGVG